MSTVSPCFMLAPWCETSCRYAVQLTRPGEAASSQVRWAGLGHQLVGLDQRQLGQAAVVRLEAPDALLRVHHRVVVAGRVLELDRQAVRDDLVTRLPLRDARADAQHDAGQVGADDVEGLVVLLRQRRVLAVALQEAERRDRLEDRRPHGVVVDGAGHHRDDRLARAELGRRDVLQVQALARVLVAGGEALEHVDLVGAHDHALVAVGHAAGRRRRRSRRSGSRCLMSSMGASTSRGSDGSWADVTER